MLDISDCESDAGASPSVSSDESSNNSCSSRSSSPAIKFNNGSRKRASDLRTPTPTKSETSNFDVLSTVLVGSGRKSLRQRQMSANNERRANTSPKIEVKTPSTPVTPVSTRKRKRSSKTDESKGEGDSTCKTLSDKKARSKRRRTRSERNLLAGKTGASPVKRQVVTEGEEAEVALDAEIDRVLEEKAIKNNLSATNVKSIIHHVITNNMVRKILMAHHLKKQAAEAGLSSDDEGLLEPKMTRAKMKELLEKEKDALWPIVDSPVKKKKPVSETHMLIQHDLPEDSSGDEEYVPKEQELNETIHSDDESSSVASVASDAGSPAAIKQRVMTRRSMQAEAEKSVPKDLLFKTPPPKPRSSRRNQEDSAVSRRTRSKLPLTDTALEDLERQFVPPDVTNDMYDWGTAADNEDYLAFLQEFSNPGLNINDVNEVDDEADPEYNVMEDDEDLHDREELRRDRAVKVPKKELTQLIAELFEQASCDEFDDHDFSYLTGFTPLIDDSGYSEDGRRAVANTTANDFQNTSMMSQSEQSIANTSIDASGINNSVVSCVSAGIPDGNDGNVQGVLTTIDSASAAAYFPNVVGGVGETEVMTNKEIKLENSSPIKSPTEPRAGPSHESAVPVLPSEPEVPLFTEIDIKRLQQQMRQHVQLVTQSYILTASSEDPDFKKMASLARSTINSVKSFADRNGPNSSFSVCNLQSAWTLVNFWPHKILQKSPIKKKILEEKYISECGINAEEMKNSGGGNYFPRHVVKVIVENPTFIYNELLPHCFDQKNRQKRSTFCFPEDALIVGALDDFKKQCDDKNCLATSNMAEVISEVLLVGHLPHQVYHRIRNLKKVQSGKGTQSCAPEIKKYFTDGVLPPVDRTVIELTDHDKLPIIQRDRDKLPQVWQCLLKHYEESSAFKWEASLTHDPVTKSHFEKHGKRAKTKTASAKKAAVNQSANSDSVAPVKNTKRGRPSTINRVFPRGALEVELEQPNSDMKAIPLYGPNGKTGAIVYIPKYALPATPKSPRSSGLQFLTPVKGSNQNFTLEEHPKEGEEAGMHIEVEQHQSASADNVSQGPSRRNLNPEIDGVSSFSSADSYGPGRFVKLEPAQGRAVTPTYSPNIEQVQYTVIEAVGKPFDLPELTASTSSQQPVVIDLASLQTPLKMKIFEKVSEQETIEVECGKVEVLKAEHIEGEGYESSNVIEEGTEYELTSEEEIEAEPEPYSPEVVTLSDDEGDGKNKPVVMSACVKEEGRKCNERPDYEKNEVASGNCESSQQVNHRPLSSSSVSSTTKAHSRRVRGRGGNGNDSDEDDERRPNNNRKRNLPKDYEGESEGSKDEPTEKEETNDNATKARKSNAQAPLVSSSSQAIASVKPTSSSPPMSQQQQSSSKYQRKKRSPGNQNVNRRVSKYNVAPPEQLIEDDPDEFDEAGDTYVEAFLTKVHTVTESKHPGLYASFVQLLHEAGEKSLTPSDLQMLHAKVKSLFKDYPELLGEFELFLNAALPSSQENPTAGSSTNVSAVNDVQFLEKLKKYTKDAPQVMAKIINKCKSLKEGNPNLTEKDLARALEPFFAGNPVMMSSFKDVIPLVYQLLSVPRDDDFEVVELDMDEPPKDNHDDLQFEIIKLPEETTVPATNTCPCVCHTNVNDVALSSRSKHCSKCALKFQDGKIFFHNGKVMRPVSVELNPASPTKCSPTSASNRYSNSTNHDPRLRKDSSHLHQPKPKEFKEPETKQSEKKVCPPQHSPHAPQQQFVVPLASPTSSSTNVVSGSSNVKSTCEVPAKVPHSSNEVRSSSSQPEKSTAESSSKNLPSAVPDQSVPKCSGYDEWTEEEDTIILSTCQEEPCLKTAFKKMSVRIPNRTIEQIKTRYSELIELLQNAGEGDEQGLL